MLLAAFPQILERLPAIRKGLDNEGNAAQRTDKAEPRKQDE